MIKEDSGAGTWTFNRGLAIVLETAQKMKFFTKDFLTKCDQIHRKLWKTFLKNSKRKEKNYNSRIT